MSVEPVEEDSNRHLRWQVREGLPGGNPLRNRVSVLDISPGGALLELTHRIRPGSLSFLTVSGDGQEVSLRYRVVQSAIHRYQVSPTGEHEHTYRAGVEFLALSEDSRFVLEQYISFWGKKREDPSRGALVA